MDHQARPARASLPKSLHPFLVMGYLLILSALIVLLQWGLKSRAAHSGPSSQEETAQGEAGLLGRLKGGVPTAVSSADKEYVNALVYEQKSTPLFQKLLELDTELSKPDLQLSDSRFRELNSTLDSLSDQAEQVLAPTSLGPCAMAIKTAVDQERSALNFYKSYQQTPTPQLKGSYDENLRLSRNQRNYCQSLIELLKKQLGPDLTLSQDDFQRIAQQELSTPPPAQPSPGISPQAPLPAPGFHQPAGPMPPPIGSLPQSERVLSPPPGHNPLSLQQPAPNADPDQEDEDADDNNGPEDNGTDTEDGGTDEEDPGQ